MITHKQWGGIPFSMCGVSRPDLEARGEVFGGVPTCIWCLADRLEPMQPAMLHTMDFAQRPLVAGDTLEVTYTITLDNPITHVETKLVIGEEGT